MKHETGAPVAVAYQAHCATLFQAIFKSPIDSPKLRAALRAVVEDHPFLHSDAPICLWHAALTDRPTTFDNAPYHLCWYQNYATFEMSRSVADAYEALSIFHEILEKYADSGVAFDAISASIGDAPYDSTVKSVGQTPEEAGYKSGSIPTEPTWTTHVLHLEKAPLEAFIRKADTNPFLALIPLLSRQICKTHELNSVSTAFWINGRPTLPTAKPASLCSYRKEITYDRHMDRYPLPVVATLFRDTLDVFAESENLLSYEPAPSTANLECEYLGPLPFSPQLSAILHDFRVFGRTQTADALLLMCDWDGRLILSFSERFASRDILDEFIRRCEKQGFPIQLIEKTENMPIL